MNEIPPRLTNLLTPGTVSAELADRFVAAGFSFYLVGGSVRDALLGLENVDLDYTTNARPEEIKKIVEPWADAVWSPGERFGTVACEKNGNKLEITTFRSETYRDDSRKPEVAFSDDIATDLSRRDFTVNAMALQLPNLELLDPYNGAADLTEKRLRTPLSAEISFLDDPLRMLRAARFIASLGLVPEPEIVEDVKKHRERLKIVSAERVRDEFNKLLLCENPTNGLWFLTETGLSDEFFPELNAMRLEQDPVHQHKDVLAHTIAVVHNTRPKLRLRLAAIMHDIAKPKTRAFGPNGVTFHHHDVVGARMAEKRMRELKYPNDIIDDVKKLVFLHLRIHTYAMGWTDSAVRRYARDAGDLLDDLNELVRCDCTTRNKQKAEILSARVDELEARIEELRAQEELSSLRPPLNGDQVMEFLGVPPGRVIGNALDFLLENRLDEGPVPETDAYERLRKWAIEQGIDLPAS